MQMNFYAINLLHYHPQVHQLQLFNDSKFTHMRINSLFNNDFPFSRLKDVFMSYSKH